MSTFLGEFNYYRAHLFRRKGDFHTCNKLNNFFSRRENSELQNNPKYIILITL
jgi:hypothetical protein